MNPDQILWIDFETASDLDLKAVGGYRYAYDDSTIPIVLAYAIGTGPVQVWHDDGRPLRWAKAPADLTEAYLDGMLVAAWNAEFDFHVWNAAWPDAPLEPGDIIDAAAQAMASGLPAGLEGAAGAVGVDGKQPNGKQLIKLFCIQRCAPSFAPTGAWPQFLSYAGQDIVAMRAVFQGTLALLPEEWRHYQAALAINRRGIEIDRAFAQRADKLMAEAIRQSNIRLRELTGGNVDGVTKVAALGRWVYDSLPTAALRALLEKDVEEDEEDEDEEKESAPGITMKRNRLELLIAAAEKHGGLEDVVEAVTLRLWGGGSSFKKYARMLDQSTNRQPRLRGQFVFKGAPQTGRFSGKGVQLQNLTRTSLGEHELPIINRIMDDPPATPAEIDKMGAGEPTLRKLGLLVRPTLVAPPGKVLVWSDFAQIEARVLPWLAGAGARSAVAKLEMFDAVDKDPSLPGLYEYAAGGMYGLDPSSVGKKSKERQAGKISELACGFGGSFRALQSMGAGMGTYFPDEQAKEIVALWRKANPWAPRFWGDEKNGESFGLWGAAMQAYRSPGVITQAGRIRFVFMPDYLRGTLFMELPSGRMLTYAGLRCRAEEVEVVGLDGTKHKETREIWRYRRGYGFARLWRGILAENATQATAADLLLGTIERLEHSPVVDWMPLVAHVHDEVVAEVAEELAADAERVLRDTMRQGFHWTKGLPLSSDETISPYYTKNEG